MSDGEGKVRHPVDEMVDDLRARQRNTVFPDGLVTGGDVDELMWKGSDKLPLVQRWGIAIFGVFFLLGSIMFAFYAVNDRSVFGGMVAAGFLYIGARVLFNSIPKRKPTK